MKKIGLILIMLLLTGCTCKYEIEINSDSIKEKITSEIYASDYEEVVPGIDPDDMTSSFVNNEQYPLNNREDITYDKTVTNKGNYEEVVLEYEYSFDDFKNYSNTLRCFENVLFEKEDNEINVKLSGQFYCLYGESLDIVISSKNRITNANGKKIANTYTWTINNDNFQDVNIEFKISETSMIKYYIYIGIIAIAVIGIIIFVLNVLNKISSRNDVNEI